jgi:hypothetical protein
MTLAAQKRMEETRAYIRENFRFNDRLAIVTIPRKAPQSNNLQTKEREEREIRPRAGQRIATAEQIVSDGFQASLRFQNANGMGIYISMNPLRPDATRRRKDDVAEIRHVYLDVDEGGAAARDALLARDDIPIPNDILKTSPNRFQFVWSVEGFSKEAAESLMRGMTRRAGADVADTDCSRVLRLPGFTNQKLDQIHWITRGNLHQRMLRPEDFPRFELAEFMTSRPETNGIARSMGEVDRSQSAKDYGFARRALRRGQSAAEVETAIAAYRTDKGHDAARYARVTVESALRKVHGLSVGM